MKLVIFGLSITSSWGNGHATTYRALARALHARGHRIVFFEREQEWYASNCDLSDPEFCEIRIFRNWRKALPDVRRELQGCDCAVVGSYFLDGIEATQEILDATVPVTAFYDIDTPITVAKLRSGGAEYLRTDQVPVFDLYFSFTGGPMLRELETRFGARKAVPLYCSVDPQLYYPHGAFRRYACDLSYMGTYAVDRQAKLETLFCEPARALPQLEFILAGSQYPRSFRYPANARLIKHLSPRWHAHLYSSSRFVLNLTRQAMVSAGYSPSVRLFEAAACGATILTDNWPGLESFFVPNQEILVAETSGHVLQFLRSADRDQMAAIGRRARERVLAEHTADHRAEQFESYLSAALSAKISHGIQSAPMESAVSVSETSLP